MILTIDVGNTRVKWVLYQGEKIADNGVFEYSLNTFKDSFIVAMPSLEGVTIFIGNVAGARLEKMLTEVLETSGCKNYVYAQTEAEQCGVVNSYADFSRLGVDRWLGMIAGFHHGKRAEGDSVCIIDCGTAITLDVVDPNGRHLGGVIAPGYRLMRSMLNQKTNDINALETNESVSSICLANTTDDAVRQGCAQLLVGGLARMISRYSESQKNKMCCIVTGGDGGWVADLLEVEVVYESMLVNQGLWYMSKELLKIRAKDRA